MGSSRLVGLALALLAAAVGALALLGPARDDGQAATRDARGGTASIDTSSSEPVRPTPVDAGTRAEAEPRRRFAPLVVEVLDASGSPVPRAEVVVGFERGDGAEHARLPRGSTDENGRCAFDPGSSPDAAECRAWLVRASAGGPDLLPLARVTPGSERVVLRAVRTGRLLGRVTWREGSDAPLLGTVEVRCRLGEGVHLETVWIEDGEFEASGIAGRVSSLTFQGVTKLDDEGLHRLGPIHVAADLAVPSDGTVRAEFALDPPADLRARFVDATTGKPVRGVRVVSPHDAEGSSDREGRLLLRRVLRRGGETWLEFEHYRYSPAGRHVAAALDEGLVELEIALEPARRIDSRVVDVRGVPLSGVGVGCRPARSEDDDAGTASGARIARTGEDGRFRLSSVPARGLVRVSFQTPRERGRDVTWSEVMPVQEALARERWVIPDPVALRGFVLDAAGEPLAGVAVVAERAGLPRRTARSDAGGEFELAGVLPGVWVLSVERGARVRDAGLSYRERAEAVVDVGPDGASGVALRFAHPGGRRPEGRARVRVIEASDGGVVERATVTWKGRDVDLLAALPTDRGPDGTREFRLPEGRYELVVGALGYRPERRTVDVGATEPLHVVALRRR